MDTSSTGAASLYDTLMTLLPQLLPGRVADSLALAFVGMRGPPAGDDVLQQPGLAGSLPTDPQLELPLPCAGPDAAIAFGLQRAEVRAPPGGDDMPALTVHLLDGLQVAVEGRLLPELPGGKTRSLFKLLLLHRRRPLPRARLSSLLWPQAEMAGARNSLNVAIHRLRRALGHPELIRHSDAGYQLAGTGAVWLDTECFLLHAAMGALEEARGRPAFAIGQYEMAMALYRSDLLDDGDDEPALVADARALRDRLNQIVERLATLREDSGDLHGCLRAAHRHLALDECNEVAHRRLMRCYARLGQPQLAESQYRQCVLALKAQLGMSPEARTTELCRRIGQHEAV